MKVSGIYKITSIRNPKRIYIGSALNVYRRWNEHLRKLEHNVHVNAKIQNHYNKYGKDDFIFSLIVGCDKSDLLSVEQYFIDIYKPWFNINKTAGSRLGMIPWNKGLKTGHIPWNKGKKNVYSDDAKRKMRNAKLGRIVPRESVEKMLKTQKEIRMNKLILN